MDFCIVDEDILDINNTEKEEINPFLTFVSVTNFSENNDIKLCSIKDDDNIILETDNEDIKLR